MQAVITSDRAAGVAGLSLSEVPYPHAAENDVIVRVHAAAFTPGELDWPGTWTDRARPGQDTDRTGSRSIGNGRRTWLRHNGSDDRPAGVRHHRLGSATVRSPSMSRSRREILPRCRPMSTTRSRQRFRSRA